VLIAPAMNANMYRHPATQANLDTLRKRGIRFIGPGTGRLACGDDDVGRMAEPAEIVEAVAALFNPRRDFAGRRVLVTAGPTQEDLDPVRYLTNRSSGKMGYAIAKAAARRGAEVTLVSGPVSLAASKYVSLVPVRSAQEMYEAVMAAAKDADVVIKAAAVADYRPASVADNKLKKKDGELSIPLERTKDILAALGESKRPGQFLCGFSMETENMLENSRKKLEKKHLDLIAANNVKVAGAGFAVDTNVLTLITPDELKELPLLSKDAAADALLDEIVRRIWMRSSGE
jgi:phosphopantothenoylcysteine decarboxylase/phosphopantothenate--cysteine ligase